MFPPFAVTSFPYVALILFPSGVEVSRINEGVERRITEVSEVLRLDPESNELTFNTFFSWDKSKDMITFTGEPELLKEIADKGNVCSE